MNLFPSLGITVLVSDFFDDVSFVDLVVLRILHSRRQDHVEDRVVGQRIKPDGVAHSIVIPHVEIRYAPFVDASIDPARTYKVVPWTPDDVGDLVCMSLQSGDQLQRVGVVDINQVVVALLSGVGSCQKMSSI